MANAFSKEEIVFFEQILEGFDPNNITAKQVMKYQPPSTQFERAALTVNRPVPYISKNVDGLTVSTFEDITQLSVPSTLNANASAPSDIRNVPFKMNAVELNDPQQRDRKARSAVQALSALVDRTVANRIALYGSLVGRTAATGDNLSTYNDIAQAEEQMSIRDVPLGDPRTIVLNPADYNNVAGVLAGGTDKVQMGVGLTAFERSKIPMVGTFESFKANFMPFVSVRGGTGSWTVTGAQDYIPVATSGGSNVDNRFMNLVVGAGTGTIAAGDKFTIFGVNSVGLINKEDTGQLQTFTVIARVDATNITISPPVIDINGATLAEQEYGNCSAPAGAGAAIVFLNTVAAPANVFFQNQAVEIVHGSLATADLDGAGMATMREATDSGIEILFAKQAAIGTLETSYRLTMWMNANVLIPDMCGILLGNQTF